MTRIPTDTCLPGTAPEEWGPLPSRVAELEAEVTKLRTDNVRLEQQAEHARLVNAGPPRPASEALERVSELEGLLMETRLRLKRERRRVAELEAQLAERDRLRRGSSDVSS